MSRFDGSEIPTSAITPEEVFLSRRRFLAGAASLLALPGVADAALTNQDRRFTALSRSQYSAAIAPNRYEDVSTYNNYYEFGTSKEDPAIYAHTLRPDPWSIRVEGEVKRAANYSLDDFIKPFGFEERVYRFRCVEAWSMVVPWVGIPLRDVIKHLEPNSRAKYLEFTTLHDPQQMPGQRRSILDWPYVEGLRMDEAMHPLTILAVGMYGKVLPNQNGAPIRLIVPWKYGFKNIKSIVRIRFVEQQPLSTWMRAGPSEYGFYANVNPAVDHPRWSQARERRLGEIFKQETLPFNGYAEHVASLYNGMDLRKFF